MFHHSKPPCTLSFFLYHMEVAAHWTCASVPPTSSLATKTGHRLPRQASQGISGHTTSLISGVSRAMKNWEQKWRDRISACCPQLSLVIELRSNFACRPSLPLGPCPQLTGIPKVPAVPSRFFWRSSLALSPTPVPSHLPECEDEY